jgi:hypothetical protein
MRPQSLPEENLSRDDAHAAAEPPRPQAAVPPTGFLRSDDLEPAGPEKRDRGRVVGLGRREDDVGAASREARERVIEKQAADTSSTVSPRDEEIVDVAHLRQELLEERRSE